MRVRHCSDLVMCVYVMHSERTLTVRRSQRKSLRDRSERCAGLARSGEHRSRSGDAERFYQLLWSSEIWSRGHGLSSDWSRGAARTVEEHHLPNVHLSSRRER